MKKNFFTLTIVALFATLFFTNCGGGSSEPAQFVTYAQIDSLHYDKDNDGKRFYFEGFPYIMETDMRIGSDRKAFIYFYSEPRGKGKMTGAVQLGYKNSKNGFYIPDEFTSDDLQVTDNQGNEVSLDENVKVSFTMKLDVRRGPNEKTKKYYGDGAVNVAIEKMLE